MEKLRSLYPDKFCNEFLMETVNPLDMEYNKF